MRVSAGGNRALHSESVGDVTLTRPSTGFHSGIRSSCWYAAKQSSAGTLMG